VRGPLPTKARSSGCFVQPPHDARFLLADAELCPPHPPVVRHATPHSLEPALAQALAWACVVRAASSHHCSWPYGAHARKRGPQCCSEITSSSQMGKNLVEKS